MAFIGQLTRFGVPLLGGRSGSTAMTYHKRGSYVTQLKGHFSSVGSRHWPKTTAVLSFQCNTRYTHTQHRAVGQTTTLRVSPPANSVPAQPCHIRTPHHRTQCSRGATLPLLLSSPRQFSTTSRVSCSAIIPSSIMTDRDILPGIVKPSHYDLSIASMNFEDWSYQGHVS